MTEPTAADGPVTLYVDYAGFYIAFHGWRTICATKDFEAAKRCLEHHLKGRPNVKVVGGWE